LELRAQIEESNIGDQKVFSIHLAGGQCGVPQSECVTASIGLPAQFWRPWLKAFRDFKELG